MAAMVGEALAARGARAHGDPQLSSQLEQAWQTARAAWPDVQLGAEAFVAHVLRHVPQHASAIEYLQQASTTDLYLACACGHGDAHAVAAFERHCLSAVDRALARLRVSADVVAEVKQRIRCRVLVPDRGPPRILDFSGRGALRAWIRVMAVREALRIARQAKHEGWFDEDSEKLHAFVAPDQHSRETKDHFRRAFAQAFDHALRGLPVRDQNLLRQHVLDGLTIDQLGALYRVHRATAARMLERARQEILSATRAHMCTALDINSAEYHSILRAIGSRLEISLRGLRRRRSR
jgi:RNA polymerase sigma-70 factor (ECF subfamily)